jgi:S-adenosylmethionine:tRNA ribosyltransferase-isomerase
MLVADFDFDLPDELIAQEPSPARGGSRLLVLDRAGGIAAHATFTDLPAHLRAGDLLVVNDTRVFPARLRGRRVPSGGAVEVLLLARGADGAWEALANPGRRLAPGARMVFEGGGRTLEGEILARDARGRRRVGLTAPDGDVMAAIDALGHVPLPPYIARDDTPADRERYQTVYARARGSVAAPTAGLHFTPAVLDALAAKGVERASITLHVGYGTFKPVTADEVEGHTVDAEHYAVPAATAEALTRAKAEGRRVIAVGTTTVRALESLAVDAAGRVAPADGETALFIHPGHAFRLVDGMVTNFHLPRSSLLMLVAALAGRERVLAAYREAIARSYRFYSYGDAMLVA